jgi:hypothetical protein
VRRPKKPAELPSELILQQMVLTQREMIAKVQEACEELDEYTKELAERLRQRP